MRLQQFRAVVSAANQLLALAGELAKNGALLRNQLDKFLKEVGVQFDTHRLKAPPAA